MWSFLRGPVSLDGPIVPPGNKARFRLLRYFSIASLSREAYRRHRRVIRSEV